MKVLVIGSGGRESTLAWKLAQSESVEELFAAPGNAGTACYGKNVPIEATDFDELVQFARDEGIDLTVVGPEKPLVDGIVDRFRENGLKIFGPTQAAARLEGSKVFAKEFMRENDIPTAEFTVCAGRADVEAAVTDRSFPYVIKVDGLAGGKGALIIRRESELEAALQQIFEEGKFGAAAEKVIVEDFLRGEELSVFAIAAGEDYVLLPPAQDHKRAFDNDEGPNTGGMGAYAPAPLATAAVMQEVETRIIQPTLKGMSASGTPYTGVLYCGLMVAAGQPYVMEFNARFGDPEAQVTVPLIESDLAELLLRVADDRLEPQNFRLTERAAACVVLASGGYPGSYETGKKISGIQELFKSRKAVPFLAGTRMEGEDYVTSGGRVLGVTVISRTLIDALKSVYNYVRLIHFDAMHYRRDIGASALGKR